MSALLASAAIAMSSRAVRPVAAELCLQCSDGMKIAAQSWRLAEKDQVKRRVLALHGWMDNSASFHSLGPRLVEHFHGDTEVVALDFIGHGLSSHKSIDGQQTMLAEGAYYVAEAVEQLQWNHESTSFTLIGHSMGAAISCLYSAAFPEQVEQLVLLDGAGPLARNPRDVAKHVRAHIQRRQNGNQQRKAARVYPTLEEAVETRCMTAKNFPGNQYLSKEAAMEMVKRGSQPAPGGGVQFRHDPRLVWPSLQYFTLEQTEALYQDVQSPTCLLVADDGWPFDEEKMGRCLELLQPNVFKSLPGSHHFHADPDTAETVAEEVISFLEMS